MKRLRSSEDLDDKSVCKDLNSNSNSSSNLNRSLSSNRSFYYKSDNVRKGLMSPSSGRYDRDRAVGGEDREGLRVTRKRSDEEFESSDRRKGFDRHRDCSGDRGGGYGGLDRMMIHRSESFCGSRRDFPKGFRSERDRSRREGSVSSWRRFGVGTKDYEEKGSLRSPRVVLRDVKSPSWSKDSGSEQSRMRSPRSPKGFRDAKSKSKSPSWSKDSGSEQSKSVEVKKVENLGVESGSSSEMEEGELEPELEVGTENEAGGNVGSDGNSGEAETEHPVENMSKEEDEKPLAVEEGEHENRNVAEGENVKEEAEKLMVDEIIGGDDKVEVVAGEEDDKEESSEKSKGFEEEVSRDIVVEKSLELEEDNKEDKGRDLDVKEENIELESHQDVTGENGASERNMACGMECATQNFKDKGKSVAVNRDVSDSVEMGVWIERESSDVLTSRDKDMEGPSSRGFELFSSSPVRRTEKADRTGVNNKKDEKLAWEPLDLSLSLPNVLLPIGAQDAVLAPGSPSQARSVQSLTSTFCTNSDGFTASMSFSGSQSFFHNPSCSLTQNNSVENYEHSVGSRPIFQGAEWLALAQNESKHKDVPLYQKTQMSGQALDNISNGQAMQGQRFRPPEGISKVPNSLERQLSFHKHLPGQARHGDDTRSPSQSVGSHEIGSNYSFDKKHMRDKHGKSAHRISIQKEPEQLSVDRAGFVETVAGIVSEPIHVMTRKLHEMPGQSISCLKEGIREFVLNADKHGKLYAIQKALQNRSDITLEMLLKSHLAQLEILVALKTGLSDFLKPDSGVSSSHLAEIFLNLRCRNITCKSLLPVDECECKVCSQKNGFCSACMCLVCTKFDMASNTCSWVGCDFCLHWCHVDCGLRESYIINGHSATGSQGTTEMQFHCVACDHPSEMFGFVKEVFQNFAKDWTTETFSRELEYVKRIFSASKDMRGKRLQEIADQMLARLTNKANLPDVYSHIMAFLTDNESSKLANMPISSREEHGKGSTRVTGPSQDNSWLKSVYSGKPHELERAASMLPLPSFQLDQNDKRPMESELQRNVQKEPLFDELESIVRIKQAEAKMFQGRADDARREAEGLKRIAIAKNEKIEEEYKTRIQKLRLFEAEETRKQRFEELQALERSHREYFSMKMRMEADIKDLLLKMEATKRNLAL